MNVKLLINPKASAVWEKHEETGAEFLIKPITPEHYADLRRKCQRQDGTLDGAKWGEEFAAGYISDWKGVGTKDGTVPASDDNLRAFGRAQAINIMPWVIERSTSLDFYRAEEEQAAKNA